MKKPTICFACFLVLTAGQSARAGAPALCRIEVVEQGDGWPVPLVELRTTHQERLVSDNAGIIAFDLPELMGRETWFEVIGQGYEVPKDGFGYRGVRLTPRPGGNLRVEVRRTTLARRLGRLTGAGLFAESQKLGERLDWPESGVLGCDSVQNAIHEGKMIWIWGDTTLAKYPLGIFDGTGATSPIQPLRRFEPPLQLPLDYFVNEAGKPRGIAAIGGPGPTWLTGVISLRDQRGAAQLVATYAKIKPPMEAYERGLAIWRGNRFERFRTLWTNSLDRPIVPPMPDGHPAQWTDPRGKQWILVGNPFPTLRFPATFEAWSDPSRWESLLPQPVVSAAGENHEVKPHSGSIAWNRWRKRWVAVFLEAFGKPSALGELWYTEADAPTGPWGPAVKILSHNHYTFYNPRIHPEFAGKTSPFLLFEGTYTATFSDARQPTPRYDYNQILYRLDLDDPDLTGLIDPPRAKAEKR